MKLRRAFIVLSLLLSGMLVLIGGVTLRALSAFDDVNATARHREGSTDLMVEVRLEMELLGRLVSSYVSTANPRFLIYYYDILGIREGTKPRPAEVSSAYWEAVIAGMRVYQPPSEGAPLSLIELAGRQGFDEREREGVGRILMLAEQLKELDQVAFAATQGLYDPVRQEFVSEHAPVPAYAAQLLHSPAYLKLRGDLVRAVDELARLVDARTQQEVNRASAHLGYLILVVLALILAAIVLLLFSYRYLVAHLIRPLLALHDAADALARQSYDERVGDVRGFAEVQLLATTMDGMAAAIQTDIAQREQARAELAEARARAEVAAEAKSIFLANMSHEIRTPMNAILGMAYLALKSNLQPAQRNHVTKIHDAAKSLLGILNDILDYSKIEAGKMQLEAAPFDLQSVVQNALFMVQQRAQDKHLELMLDYRVLQGSAFVGDSLRLGQVLINLLSNAVKFTERGHVRLSVSDWDNEDGTSVLHFAVEDTGIGMGPEALERLFKEFSQADGSTTRKYGGTGLGLSISQRLVEAMGGQIRVESQLERGSRFDFAIRLQVAGGEPKSGTPLAGMSALVVDDYAPARECLRDLLQSLGCSQVDLAVDGESAVLKLTGEERGPTYDLVFLDWQMPGMSGLAVIDALRGQPVAVPPRIILLASLDAGVLRDQRERLDGADILQKPVLPRQLCELLAHKAPPGGATVAGGADQGGLAGMRVLVVEDNEINRQVAAEILEAWGVTVDLAEDGRQGLDRILTQPPTFYDLVLMDLEMPVLDGREAIRCLRADGHFETLPVYAMTAHAVSGELAAALDAGMTGHISKPFEPDDLFALLARHRRPTAGQRGEMAKSSISVETSEAADFAPLLAVAGVDVPSLVKRFPGKGAFITRLLKRFGEEQRDVVRELAAKLAEERREAALLQAHTLKGLAGNLGLNEVQARAERLEQAIQENIGDPLEALQALADHIGPVLAGVSALPDAPPREASTGQVVDALTPALARLRTCLCEGDGEAEAVWLTHQAQFAEAFSLTDCKQLGKAIATWEFDEALQVLDRLLAIEGGHR